MKLVPWSVMILSGTPTLKNSWMRQGITAGAVMVAKGNTSGNQVA